MLKIGTSATVTMKVTSAPSVKRSRNATLKAVCSTRTATTVLTKCLDCSSSNHDPGIARAQLGSHSCRDSLLSKPHTAEGLTLLQCRAAPVAQIDQGVQDVQ